MLPKELDCDPIKWYSSENTNEVAESVLHQTVFDVLAPICSLVKYEGHLDEKQIK